jgi:DNA repair protein RadC
MAITDWPLDERPREKLLARGADALSDAELLAIFLRTGLKGQSALDLARSLIKHYGDLKSLLNAKREDFCSRKGMGDAKYCQLQASMEMSKRYFRDEMREETVITNPDTCKRFVRHALSNRQHETFAVVYLNNQHTILSFEELFQGTIDAASVYPREVVRKVLDKGAAAVIICHNHPSGSTVVSQADRHITKRLQSALELIDVRVLDHLIVAGNEVVSFAEQGLL